MRINPILAALATIVMSFLLPAFTTAADNDEKPMASSDMASGVVAEVTAVRRTTDGALEVVWRYRNPTSKNISLFDGNTAAALMSKVYVIDETGKTKYSVSHLVDKDKKDQYLASEVAQDVPPGQSMQLWAKFKAPPSDSQTINLYLPGAAPMEDLSIESAPKTAPAPLTNAAGNPVLASQTIKPGLKMDVITVKRGHDGNVEIRWQYSNQSDSKIQLFHSGNEISEFPRKLYVIDPDTHIKYGPAIDTSGEIVAGTVEWQELDAGMSGELWAKFPVAADAKRLTLYVPQAIPVEDLAIPDLPQKKS